MKKTLLLPLFLGAALLAGCTSAPAPSNPSSASGTAMTDGSSSSAQHLITAAEAAMPFGQSVTYAAPTATINKDIAADFSADEATNLAAIQKTYGIKLSAAEVKFFRGKTSLR